MELAKKLDDLKLLQQEYEACFFVLSINEANGCDSKDEDI